MPTLRPPREPPPADVGAAKADPSRGARGANPYRDDPFLARFRVDDLLRENTSLRTLAGALLVLAIMLVAVAAWYFGLLWNLTK